jgi:hypothetical protein
LPYRGTQNFTKKSNWETFKGLPHFYFFLFSKEFHIRDAVREKEAEINIRTRLF